MQENQNKPNNAIEKVENIANGNSTASQGETHTQERMEMALKQAKIEKQKIAKRREMQRQKEQQAKEKRAQIQAEKEKQEMIKNQSLEEQRRLKRLEKQAKIELKQQKRQDKANLKREKFQAKKELREKKFASKAKRKEQNRGFGGWLAAVIVLSISTIALATALTLTFLIPQEADLAMESAYSRSFYDTVEQVDNMDLNMSKALVTKDSGAMQKYLVDLAINSELAENDIQQLPLQDESKFYTTKLINQIGDFAKYLNKKIIDGENLSANDKQTLQRLYTANLTLKESLQTMMQKMTPDFSFSSMVDGGNGNLIIENFNQLQNLSVEYPELIYDGPFSDGVDRFEIKGLTDNEITKGQAKDHFKEIFKEYNIDKVEMTGETNANIQSYNMQGMVNGDLLYAQISKKGGKLVMFAYAGSCNKVNYQDDSAIEKAQGFLDSLGIKDMKPVWINLANNVYTINFAYEQDGVIVYSDLIKVRVCAETNMVIGLEATSYWTNHTERPIPSTAISKQTAMQKVSSDIEIQTCRLALVPVGQSTEKLCYEFMGEKDGTTYYVYINAITGKQTEMFKVVSSSEGTLLM